MPARRKWGAMKFKPPPVSALRNFVDASFSDAPESAEIGWFYVVFGRFLSIYSPAFFSVPDLFKIDSENQKAGVEPAIG